MSRKLKVFFDYACPFCLRGHKLLEELLPRFPDVEVEWSPCESHPRPERYGPHSDLCIRGMFFAREEGVDLAAYHALMYDAALNGRVDIENPAALADYAGALLDRDRFLDMLRSGGYQSELDQANRHAFEESGVWAVPAFRLEGEKLDAVENIGVTREQLERLLGGGK